ncbi:MAG: tRNA pseudouridine(13) synthase TruD [Phycisphaerae bacterium]|nr:tRNA pseudouridine(13) synthase TruD [Phycisphaerae bacterium]
MTIRRSPDDFLVEEEHVDDALAGLRAEPSASHRHAVYELRKRSITTPQAVAYLAAALRARPNDASFAGLKDRHASTVQLVSIGMRGGACVAGNVESRGWHATLVGWSDRPVDSTWSRGNRFTIVVRDLDRVAAMEMDRRREPLMRGAGVVVVNYFGAQRFGSARHGGGFAAKALLRGDFETALKLLIGTPARKDSGPTRALNRACAEHWGDWRTVLANIPRVPEGRAVAALAAGASFRDAFSTLPPFTQLMCVEAYQSHLWNTIARRLVRDRVPAEAILRADDEFGEMLFPHASAIPDDLRNLTLPLLAPSSTIEPSIAAAVEATLADEGIALADLRIPGLRRPFFGDAPRPFLVEAERFDLSVPGTDEYAPKRLRRTARFALPRGAYATVVLRALGQ